MLRYLAGSDPTKVISAKADTHPKFPQIDVGTTATLAFPTPGESTTAGGLTASLLAHFQLPPVLGFLPAWPKFSLRVSGTCGTAELNYFPGVWAHHNLTVVSSEQEGGRSQKRTEKHYGNPGWTTCVTFVFVLTTRILTMCADTVTSWRHSSTKCAVAHLSIGTMPRTLSPTWSGSKPSTKKSVVISSLACALTIAFRRLGWDPVQHRQPRCQCKYNLIYFCSL